MRRGRECIDWCSRESDWIHGLILYLPEYLMMNARVLQRRKGCGGNRRPWKRSWLHTAMIHPGICVRAEELCGREGQTYPFPESTRIKFGHSLSGWVDREDGTPAPSYATGISYSGQKGNTSFPTWAEY